MCKHLKTRSLTLCLLALLTLSTSVPLLAHTDVVHSVPARDAHIEQSPERLQLTFGDTVRLMRLTLTHSDGTVVALNFRPSAPASKDHSHPLPALAAGHYTLEWSAMASDGHNMTGRFSFHVGGDTEDHQRHIKHQGHAH